MILESPFDAPLRLDVPRSYVTSLLIFIPLFFIMVVVVWFTPIHWSYLMFVVIADLAVVYYFTRLHYWQSLKSSILEINQDKQGQWSIMRNAKENDWQFVELLPTSFVSTFLIVLNFQGENRRYNVIFPAGSLDEDTFRRLRVRIKVTFS